MNQSRTSRLTLVVVFSMVAVFSGHAAAAPGEWNSRAIATPYTGPGGASGVATGTVVVGGERYGGAVFSPGDDEVLVTLRVTDDSGLPVLAEVSQDRDDTGSPDPATSVQFCGETAQPLAIRPGVPLTVRLAVGGCGSGVSVPTQGLVEATFFAPAG